MLDRDDLIGRYEVADRTTPHLRVNFVASLDGAVTREGRSGPLNNEDDKAVFDTLRMLADVVLVGAGTIRKEGYGALRVDDEAVIWRVEHGLPEHPVLATVTSRLHLDPASRMFSDAPVRPIVVTHSRRSPRLSPAPSSPAPSSPSTGLPGASGPATRPTTWSAVEAGGSNTTARPTPWSALGDVADVLQCGDTAVDPRAMVEALAARGLNQILCEGGPLLLGSLIEADAVDELCLTISPTLEGGSAGRIARGGALAPRAMRLVHAFPAGDMLFLRYLRAR